MIIHDDIIYIYMIVYIIYSYNIEYINNVLYNILHDDWYLVYYE